MLYNQRCGISWINLRIEAIALLHLQRWRLLQQQQQQRRRRQELVERRHRLYLRYIYVRIDAVNGLASEFVPDLWNTDIHIDFTNFAALVPSAHDQQRPGREHRYRGASAVPRRVRLHRDVVQRPRRRAHAEAQARPLQE